MLPQPSMGRTPMPPTAPVDRLPSPCAGYSCCITNQPLQTQWYTRLLNAHRMTQCRHLISAHFSRPAGQLGNLDRWGLTWRDPHTCLVNNTARQKPLDWSSAGAVGQGTAQHHSMWSELLPSMETSMCLDALHRSSRLQDKCLERTR